MANMLAPFLEDTFSNVWDMEPVYPRSRDHGWNELARMAMDLDRIRHEFEKEGSVVSTKNGTFQVDLDVHGFVPQDINVTVTDDKTVTVSAKHTEMSDDGLHFTSRSFSRSFPIPKDVQVQVQDFKSKLAKDGKILRIEAPVRQEKKMKEPKEVSIEINHVKTPAVGQ
jgi:HSP20 family molecular chaperone IbpA